MEGPQTHALADVLTDHLTGHPVDKLDIPPGRWQANVLLHNCVGQVIQRARAHGRWLFLDFSHGVTWAAQLLARSTWRLTSPDRPARRATRPSANLSILLRNGVRATLTGRPTFLILPTEDLYRHRDLAALGPDPIASTHYAIEFPQRLRRATGRALAAALLDQGIIAGLANPLKCELLFGIRAPATTRVGELLASDIDHLTHAAQTLCTQAYAAARRREPFDYAVYDRAGQPCPRCGSDIAVSEPAEAGPTWYCPSCQRIREKRSLFSA